MTSDLQPGPYIMQWASYSVPVQIVVLGNELVAIPPSGRPIDLLTVPDAKFKKIPDEKKP